VVQSMTNTDTADVDATVRPIYWELGEFLEFRLR
jgi:4-hydroxy-3-methylbut-2-en-1-yl diphosphate synthase IspG/GcpE